MTAPVPSPPQAAEPVSPADRRGRRVYIWWAIALTLLLAAGAFCWAVVVPVWRTRAIVESAERAIFAPPRRYYTEKLHGKYIAELGGREKAIGRLRLYIRLPRQLAPHKVIALQMIFECGEVGVPGLIENLRHDDDEVRMYSAIWLRVLKPKTDEAAKGLTAALGDEDGSVRFEAAVALSHIRPDTDGVIPVLVEFLNCKSWIGRRDAAQSLGRLGCRAEGTLPALEELLNDQKEQVRQAAAEALRKIKGAQEPAPSSPPPPPQSSPQSPP